MSERSERIRKLSALEPQRGTERQRGGAMSERSERIRRLGAMNTVVIQR
jgi:hypothetical protein